MDELVLEKKIDSILRCIQRIQSRIPLEREQFKQDLDAQDVVVLNLTRIIQLCVDIAMHVIAQTNIDAPQTMSQSFSKLERLDIIDKKLADKLKKSVGFRNIAVHNYDELDLDITFDIASKHIDDFRNFIKLITAFNFQPGSGK